MIVFQSVTMMEFASFHFFHFPQFGKTTDKETVAFSAFGFVALL